MNKLIAPICAGISLIAAAATVSVTGLSDSMFGQVRLLPIQDNIASMREIQRDLWDAQRMQESTLQIERENNRQLAKMYQDPISLQEIRRIDADLDQLERELVEKRQNLTKIDKHIAAL